MKKSVQLEKRLTTRINLSICLIVSVTNGLWTSHFLPK